MAVAVTAELKYHARAYHPQPSDTIYKFNIIGSIIGKKRYSALVSRHLILHYCSAVQWLCKWQLLTRAWEHMPLMCCSQPATLL
jgi:hypothetical protein